MQFEPAAVRAIQAVYDDPGRKVLADRLEELLDLLEADHTDTRLRRQRMHSPALWLMRVFGSGEEFAFLWDLGLNGQPFVRWAGSDL